MAKRNSKLKQAREIARGRAAARARRLETPCAEHDNPPLEFIRRCYTLRSEEGGASEAMFMRREYQLTFGEDAPLEVSLVLLRLKVLTGLRRNALKAGKHIPSITRDGLRNAKAAMLLDASKLVGMQANLVPLLDGTGLTNHSEGNATMAKAKDAKPKRKPAATTILAILSGARVPADDVIIEKVRAAHPEGNFNKAQLAWYKSRYRFGRLKGMDGKAGHIIQQVAKKSKAKAAPAAPAKAKAKAKAAKPKAKAKAKAAKPKKAKAAKPRKRARKGKTSEEEVS